MNLQMTSMIAPSDRGTQNDLLIPYPQARTTGDRNVDHDGARNSSDQYACRCEYPGRAAFGIAASGLPRFLPPFSDRMPTREFSYERDANDITKLADTAGRQSSGQRRDP